MLKSKATTFAVIAILIFGYFYWNGTNPENQEAPAIPKQTPRRKENSVKVWFKTTYSKQRGLTLKWAVGPTTNAGKPIYTTPWTNADNPIIAKHGDGVRLEVFSFEGASDDAYKTCEIFVDGFSVDGPWHAIGRNPLVCETIA